MRFLFSAWPYSGHVHPCLSVAQALRKRGHEVAFYTGAAARPVVESAGFPCFPFRALARRTAELVSSADTSDHPALYASLTERYTSVAEKSPRRRWQRVRGLYEEMLAGTIDAQAEDLNALISGWHPDVLVTDAFLWAPVTILQETRRIPVVVLSFFAGCMIPGPGAPPHGLGLPRPRTWRTRCVARVATFIMRRLTAPVRRATNEVRRKYGLPETTATYFELVGRTRLHLVASSPEYDYERSDLPESVHYAGACSYDPAAGAEPSWTSKLKAGVPVIYVSEGTCQVRQPVVLRAAAAGLAGLPVQVVMTTGRQRDPDSLDLGPVSSNTIVEPWVSLGALLPRCSVVVTNGGSGTVRAALEAGVPLVVIPMEWDQLENAQRVVECGAGLRLAPSRCTAATLRAAVERVLNSPAFASNARRIAGSFARYGQGEEAARLLDTVLADSDHREIGND